MTEEDGRKQQQQQESSQQEQKVDVGSFDDHKVAQLRQSMVYVKRVSSSNDGEGKAPSVVRNQAGKFARKMLQQSWTAQSDAALLTDIQSVLEGGCIYLPSFLCEPRDFEILSSLTNELKAYSENTGEGMINWSQHMKFENPSFSPTFLAILKRLDFDCEILATRLNYYNDGSQWKPFHHDSHAYGGNGKKEDFTIGSSFGASRELAFLHEESDQTFTFPQANGDIFAFTSDVNKKFKHGVPKVKGNPAKVGPRFSIIAWGRRRTLNERNSGAREREGEAGKERREEYASPSSSSKSAHHSYQQEQHSHGEGAAENAAAGGKGRGQQNRPSNQSSSSSPKPSRGSQEEGTTTTKKEEKKAASVVDMNAVAASVHRLVVQESSSSSSKAARSNGSSNGGEKTTTEARGNRKGRVQHAWAS